METTTQKSLLITIRDSISCSQGVRFVGTFFKHHKDLNFTFFYVMPNPASDQSMMDPWAEDNAVVSVLPAAVEKVFTLFALFTYLQIIKSEEVQGANSFKFVYIGLFRGNMLF